LLNLELIAQISTWTGEPTSSASFQAEAGTKYQLRLSSLVTEPGEFELQMVPGTAPHVTILSPKIGAPFEMGAEFFAQAHALDSDGRIVNVGWYLSDQPEHGYRFLGSRTDAPFTFAITNVLPGQYWLQAVATDDQGARSASIPVPYRVRPPNDDYARAIVLEGERVRSEFWIHGAGNEPGEESITGIGGETIWWRWTAPETGLYTIAATCGSSRPLLGVFDATDQISSLNDQLFVSTMDNSFASEFPDTVRGSIAVEKGRSYAIVAYTFSSRPEATVEIAITPGTPPLMEWAFPTAEGNVNLMAGSEVMLKLNLLNPSLALPAVELFINGHRESRLTEPPYEWLFEVGEGYYEFYARATDANGLVTVLPRRTFAGRHAPPPNDHFIDRINLSGLSVQVEGNAAGATSETNEPPVQSNTVWYAWTAPESRTFSLVLENGWDLHLYRGGALTELVPIGSIPPWENYWQPISRIWFTAEAGVEYQIAIGNTREFNLRIFPNNPPLLRMIHPLDGSLFEAGSVVPLQVEATDADNGISSVEFFLGTDPNAMQPVVPPQKPPHEYEFVLPSDRVATFYFYAEATDREGIKVKSALVRFTSYWPPLANDHFANRLDVGGDNFIVTASLATATRETGEPLHGGYTAWWSWMAPASGAAHLLAESAFVAGLSVYQGESMTQLQLIAAAAELALNKPTSVSFRVEAGQRYEIAVSSLVGTPGPVTLTGRLGVPPTIRIVNPLHNQTFQFGSIIRLEAEVVDPDNDVELVEWMLDDQLVGVATAAPFAHEFPASDRLPSVHWIQARVTDGKGWFALSLPISIATEGEPMPAPVPPMNDDFDQAMVLPEVALVSGTFFNATIEPGEPVPNNLTLAGSVWWRWTAPESGFLILNNSYPPVWEHSPRLTIYRGERVINLIAQPPLATLNVSGQIQERYAVEKGITYLIRVLVGNAQRLTVFFDLHLETAVRPALDAITISGGMTTIQGSGLPGTWLVLEHSEDLIRWFPLQTKSVPADGQIEFNDPDFLKASRRFYRLVAP
ncbi:MAG: Ig-like domain-containing protein, partial [Verrucomicrobiota bacterium]